MPKYTFEVDGQKYSVTSDTQPTKEQLLALVAKQEAPEPTPAPEILEPEKQETLTPQPESINQITQQPTAVEVKDTEPLTEETIKKDPKWIEASKTIYEWDWQRKNPDKKIPKLSDQGYAEFGLEYGGGLSYSDVDLVAEGQAIGKATDEQKQAFVDIMDMYDAKAPSWAGAGRAFKNILNPFESPTTYLGLGAGKIASTGAKQLAKDTIKQNIIKSIVASKPGRYALIGSAEGAAYGGAYETAKQRGKIRADAQEDYKPGDIAKAAGVGATFGGVLGATGGVVANAIQKRAKQTDPIQALPAPEQEVKLLAEAVPEVKPLTQTGPTKKQIDIQFRKDQQKRFQQEKAANNAWNALSSDDKTAVTKQYGSPQVFINNYIKKLEASEISIPQKTKDPIMEAQNIPTISRGKIAEEIEEIVSPLDQELKIVVDQDVGILGKIPYVGKIYKDLANNVLNKIQAKTRPLSALGDLPEQPQYIGTRGFYMGKLESVGDLTKRVFNSFNKLTPEQNKVAYEFLTGNKKLDELPENIRKNALELRQGIDTVSEVLERNGLLSKEIMEENYGTYLPRLFLKYFNKKSSPMGYLKKRKDLDDATRLFLGEIEDVGLLGAKAIEDPISDVVKLGFFKEISKNPNWAVQESLVPFRGKKIGVFHAKEEADRITKEIAEGLRTQKEIPQAKAIVKDLQESINTANQNIAKLDPKKFKQIPNQKRYGELKGMYVRSEIYDDLIGSEIAGKGTVAYIANKGKDITKIWKTLKVPLNPPSVVRNFISNMVLLNLSGVSSTRLPLRMAEALGEIITKGKYYQVAKKYGISSTTFSKQEMLQIKRMYKIAKAQKTGNWLDQADRIGSGLLNFAGDSYGFIETFGKIIKIIDDMKAGKNPETAVYNAQKTLFDYSLVPAALKEVRQNPFGVPFATFQYKVLPFLIDTFIRHPERYVKYMAVPALAAAAWQNQNKDMTENDLKTLKEALPDYLRDGGNALVWPYKDDEGRWQFYDWSYIMPWGFYTGIGNKIASGELGEATDDVVGLWGGPGLNVATAVLTNKDPFTNREIVDPASPSKDQAKDALNYLWRTTAPTWLTDIGFAGKMYEAVTKEPNYYGDPNITKPQAWWRLVGQNVYPVDPEQSRNTNLYFKTKEIADMQAYYRKKIREAQLRGDEQKVLELEQEAKEQIDRLANALAEYEEKSRLPERLKRKKQEK